MKFRFLDKNDKLDEKLNNEFEYLEKLIDKADATAEEKYRLKWGMFYLMMQREHVSEVIYTTCDSDVADKFFS